MGMLLAGLVGCSAPALIAPSAPKPRTLEVQVLASTDVNPNAEGRPSPILVHLYVLKDTGSFSGAKFDPLTRDPAAALGEALLSSEMQLVRPGETPTIPIKVDPEAGYIAAVAEFARVMDSQWSAVMAAPDKRLLDLMSTKKIQVALGQNSIRIASSD
jgi:type VI secretion system protein VasD